MFILFLAGFGNISGAELSASLLTGTGSGAGIVLTKFANTVQLLRDVTVASSKTLSI